MSVARQHIMFLVSSLGGGGAERVATLLCNHWVSQGHDVTLMATFSGRGGCDYHVDPRVRVRYLADETKAKRRSPLSQMRRLLALRRAIVTTSPDRVISFLTNVNLAALVAAVKTPVPIIVSERIYPPHHALSAFMEYARKRAYPRARAVVMQTSEGAEWLRRVCPNARGIIIPNPLKMPLPSAEPGLPPTTVVRDDRLILLSAGRLAKQKNFALLMEVFGRICDDFPQWDLVILGEGPEREALQTQIQDLNLGHRILMPGRAGNIGDWYKRAAAFVMASQYEGFPNALLEALAHGLPAVSFDVRTGPRDLISPDVNGWLVDPAHGADGLEGAMRHLLSGRWRPPGRSIEALRSRFALETIADQWLDIPV